MDRVMVKSRPPFASSEYVERWLTDIQSKLDADEKTDFCASRHSKRKRADSPNQNLASKAYASPHKQRKIVEIGRSRSPKRITAHRVEENWDSDTSDVHQPPSSSSPGLPGNVFSENYISISPGFREFAPEDPSKKYLRRPRHKPKVDKYEYKGDILKKSPAKKATKIKSKRSRRNKTGDMLNQEFKAPNVERERLTLKASNGPGIFGKGKASALLQTRGLPDLTFSEMNFLSKKRQPDHLGQDKQQTTKPTRKDRSKEISEFFAIPQSETARLRRNSTETHQQHPAIDLTEWSNSRAMPPRVKLASRIDFSLVSESMSDPGRHSERMKNVLPRTDCDAIEKVTDINQIQTSDISAAEIAGKAVQMAGATCSWSATPAKPGSRQQTANKLADAKLVTLQPAHKPKGSPIRESPVTNSSLDRYTKQLLLNEDHGLWQQSHRAPLGPNTFSLDDLKGLARIAEIEERYSGLPSVVSPPKRTVERRYTSRAPGASAPYNARPELRHGTNSAISQPDVGNLTFIQTNKTLPAARDLLPGPTLQRRCYEHDDALPTRVAPEGSASAQTATYAMPNPNARVAHAQHHDRMSNLFDFHTDHNHEALRNEQEFCDITRYQRRASAHLGIYRKFDSGSSKVQHDRGLYGEKLSFYQGSAHESLEPTMPILLGANYLGADEFDPNNLELIDNIPELQDLHYGKNVVDQIEKHQHSPEAQCVDCEYGKPSLHLGDVVHNSRGCSTWNPAAGVSIWNGQSRMYPAERPEEEFLGFSRPQVLY